MQSLRAVVLLALLAGCLAQFPNRPRPSGFGMRPQRESPEEGDMEGPRREHPRPRVGVCGLTDARTGDVIDQLECPQCEGDNCPEHELVCKSGLENVPFVSGPKNILFCMPDGELPAPEERPETPEGEEERPERPEGEEPRPDAAMRSLVKSLDIVPEKKHQVISVLKASCELTRRSPTNTTTVQKPCPKGSTCSKRFIDGWRLPGEGQDSVTITICEETELGELLPKHPPMKKHMSRSSEEEDEMEGDFFRGMKEMMRRMFRGEEEQQTEEQQQQQQRRQGTRGSSRFGRFRQ